MKIKRFLAAITAFAAMISVSACSDPKDKAPEKLRIGCEDGGYEPFEYYDGDELTGVDIELGKLIAQKIGAEVEFVTTDWDGIFDGLDRGDYDCIMSAVTIDEDRLTRFDFSDPYIQNYQCFAVLKEAGKKPSSPDEIGGLRIGYQEQTTSEDFINAYAAEKGISFTPCPYSKIPDIFADLEAGRLEAVICDSTIVAGYIGENAKFEPSWVQKSDPEEFGICIKKGNTELVNKINKALSELKSEGKLNEIMNKYF